MKTYELSHRLYYNQPAAHWEEALPLGSGRLGAMIWGNPDHDTIPLNEDTFWSGYPHDTGTDVAPETIQKVRELIRGGQVPEAAHIIETKMLGDFTQSYLPIGDLITEFPDTVGESVTESVTKSVPTSVAKSVATSVTKSVPKSVPETVTDYIRDLDLRTAKAGVSFVKNGIRYTREYFATAADQGIIAHFTADKAASINLNLSFASPLRHSVSVSEGCLVASLQAPAQVDPHYVKDGADPVQYEVGSHKGMRACMVVRPILTGGILSDGTIAGSDIADNTLSDGTIVGGDIAGTPNALEIRNADSVTLLIAIRTSFAGADKDPDAEGLDETALCKADLSRLAALCKEGGYEGLFRRHLAEYTPYYNASELSLEAETDDIPTDKRLRLFAETQDDPVLYSLLYHYGRYLLIASSRPGTAAANLQGIWNKDPVPVWSSNYTININTEMNYWPAEICGLPEMADPLFRLVDLLVQNGAKTAAREYHARGSVSHHNADIWGLTNPVGRSRNGFSFAYWNVSLGWLSRHLWDHYLYSDDVKFLRDRAYPVLAACAVYFLDMLQQNSEGHFILTPSASPENTYILNGTICKIAQEATMSQAICREVFTHVLAAVDMLATADLLSADGTTLPGTELQPQDLARIREILPQLQAERIGSKGQLLEWESEFEEQDPHHRHVSHLYGLHPAHQITPSATPELADACRRSLEIRGDDGTGWSLGWKINMWARLWDGDHALRLLRRQLRLVPAGREVRLTGGGTYPNLFDAHPPFQIDGNFGTCAGIAEMLLQADENSNVYLLPALPSDPAWADGSVHGLRAPHGLTIDLQWRDHQLVKANIHADHDVAAPIVFHYKEKVLQQDVACGDSSPVF